MLVVSVKETIVKKRGLSSPDVHIVIHILQRRFLKPFGFQNLFHELKVSCEDGFW